MRSETQQLIPLETFTAGVDGERAAAHRHHNLFRAAEVNGKGAHGVSSGQAMQAMEDLAAATLPADDVRWTGLSREEKESAARLS